MWPGFVCCRVCLSGPVELSFLYTEMLGVSAKYNLTTGKSPIGAGLFAQAGMHWVSPTQERSWIPCGGMLSQFLISLPKELCKHILSP